MSLLMECQEHILLFAQKIMFTYGNTKVKRQDLQCLSQLDK